MAYLTDKEFSAFCDATFGGLGATPKFTTAGPTAVSRTLQLQPRRGGIPVGSVVPLLRARKPVYFKPPTAKSIAAIRALDNRLLVQARAVLAMPTKTLKGYAYSVRHHLSPTALAGLGGSESDLLDAVRDMSGSLTAAIEEMRGSVGVDLQAPYGQVLGLQHVGEIAAAYGFDVNFQDVYDNLRPELERLYQDGGSASWDIWASQSFRKVAAVFRDQGIPVSALGTLAGDALALYRDGAGGLSTDKLIEDGAALCEGGVRRALEDLIGGDATAEIGNWLTVPNLQSTARVAQSWVGADSARDYLSAAGSTLGIAGAIIPQPAGAAVAAVGTMISLVGSFMKEAPPPTKPIVQSCTAEYGNKPWAFNPEAWMALSIWVCVKEGGGIIFDSPSFKQAVAENKPVQEVIASSTSGGVGWYATVDKETGEVMVQEPHAIGAVAKPFRRLLDLIDRDLLMPPDYPTSIIEQLTTSEAAYRFGAVDLRAGALQLVPPVGWPSGLLACDPDPKEIRTRFLGSLSAHALNNKKEPLQPFRGWSGAALPRTIWEQHGLTSGGAWESSPYQDWDFIATYYATLVTSMYLAGTVPVGYVNKRDLYGADVGYMMSTGVGALGSRLPLTVAHIIPERQTANFYRGTAAPAWRYRSPVAAFRDPSDGVCKMLTQYPGCIVSGRSAGPCAARALPEAGRSVASARRNSSGIDWWSRRCDSWFVRLPCEPTYDVKKDPFIPLDELPARVRDAQWCVTNRVPQQSPDKQSSPSTMILRPGLFQVGRPIIRDIGPAIQRWRDQQDKSFDRASGIPAWLWMSLLAGGLYGGYRLLKR